MKVYIDLGAYDGDSIKAFYNSTPDYKEYEIYAFEPNPKFENDLKALQQDNPKIHLSNQAAYINTEEVEWTMDQSATPMGSTLMKTKRNWGNGVMTTVKCFDFSAWLEQFRGDEVIIKMDIEGAEYDVLEKMIADGTDNIPQKMMIEFHGRKLSGHSEDREKRLQAQLRCPWEAWA